MQWLIVAGSPRSGTTYLQQVLNTHPKIACTHEVDLGLLAEKVSENLFFAEDAQKSLFEITLSGGSSSAPSRSPEKDPEAVLLKQKAGLASLHVSEREKRVAAKVQPMMVPKREDLPKIVASIVGAVSGKSDLEVVGDKYPNWQRLHSRDKLARLLGPTKYLVIVRHPLDVINSSLHRRNNTLTATDTWPIETVEDAIAEWLDGWRWIVKNAVNKDFLTVKYEDLLKDFKKTTDEIADFLGVTNEMKDLGDALPDELKLYAITEAEISVVRAAFGTLLDDWSTKSLAELTDEYKSLYTPLELNRVYSISDLDCLHASFVGFSNRTDEGRWSTGRRADVGFSFREVEAVEELAIKISLFPFFNGKSTYTFYSRSGGGPFQTHTLHMADMTGPLTAMHMLVSPSDTLEIELFMPNVKSGSDEPIDDERQLGILVTSLELVSF